MDFFEDPYIGVILPFAGNYAPVKWKFCNGEELHRSDYELLFSVIGFTYGGNGFNIFCLPNLCARVAVHAGQAPNMQQYTVGETGGNDSDKVLIGTGNLPRHNHSATLTGNPGCAIAPGTVDTPAGHYPAPVSGGSTAYSTVVSDLVLMAGTTLDIASPAASSQHHEQEPLPVMSPYCTINYIICVEGRYPTRN